MQFPKELEVGMREMVFSLKGTLLVLLRSCSSLSSLLFLVLCVNIQDQITLGQLNLGADIYHIRMDHQNPSHFLSLPHPHALSNVALNEHDYINNSKPSAFSYTLANHQSTTMPVQEATQSDIRSMSVDPGSLDEQLSSQGSVEGMTGAGEGLGGGGGGRKRGEFSGGVLSSELVVVGSGSGGVVSPPLITSTEEVIEIPDTISVSSSSSPLPEEFNVSTIPFSLEATLL